MPFRTIGAVLFPLMILAMILKQKGPVERYLKAGAVSPETARRLTDLELREHYILPDAVKRGLLVETGDGRYYVNVAAFRRRRRRIVALAIVAGLALGAAVLLIWPPWK